MASLINDAIQCAAMVRASPERVYEGIATAEGWDAWFTDGTTLDPHTGGELCFRWRAFGPDRFTGDAHGVVLEAACPNRFVFQWRPDKPTYATTVELDIEPIEEGCIIRVNESGYQDTPSGLRAMLDCATGWGEALTLLKFYVEHGIRY